MKKYGSCFTILICALLLAACAPEPEVIIETTYESVPVEVTRIVEVPVEIIQEMIVVETVEVIITPAVNFPTPAPTEQWPLSQFGDGIWLVGTEIERGIYKNIGPVGVDDEDGGSLCEWHITKCLGGWRCVRDYDYRGFHHMIKLLYGDMAFSTARCGEWVKLSD